MKQFLKNPYFFNCLGPLIFEPQIFEKITKEKNTNIFFQNNHYVSLKGLKVLFSYSINIFLFHLDPCALIDCKEEEICVPNNAISARCILYKNLHLNDEIKFKRIIHKREIVQQERIVSRLATNIKVDRGIAEPCDASECRYGECEIINATYHKCHCVMVNYTYQSTSRSLQKRDVIYEGEN